MLINVQDITLFPVTPRLLVAFRKIYRRWWKSWFQCWPVVYDEHSCHSNRHMKLVVAVHVPHPYKIKCIRERSIRSHGKNLHTSVLKRWQYALVYTPSLRKYLSSLFIHLMTSIFGRREYQGNNRSNKSNFFISDFLCCPYLCTIVSKFPNSQGNPNKQFMTNTLERLDEQTHMPWVRTWIVGHEPDGSPA